MFRSHESSIIQLILGNRTLRNQIISLDNLSKETVDLKESLEFTQEKTEGNFNRLNEKISRLKGKLGKILG